MSLVAVGLNHRTCPLTTLSALRIEAERLPKALSELRAKESINHAVVLSTCMRTEVYAEVDRFHESVADIRDFLAVMSGLAPEDFSDHVYDFYDTGAVRHLFRVAAGLDSAVLGEGEVLRQVREAWEAAKEERAVAGELSLAFRHAVETGKAVRTETSISRGTTSLSHTALSLAGVAAGLPSFSPTSPLGGPAAGMVPPEAGRCPVVGHGEDPEAARAHNAGFGAAGSSEPAGYQAREEAPASGPEIDGPPCQWSTLLGGKRLVVLGAGVMGAAVAELAAAAPGISEVMVTNRTLAKAQQLAERLGVRWAPWDARYQALASADIVITAVETSSPVVAPDHLQGRATPLVTVDLALRPNVDPECGALPLVTAFSLTDIKAHAEAAMASRRAELPAAVAIVEDNVERLSELLAERDVHQLIARMRGGGEAVRQAELARLSGKLAGLDDTQRRAVEALTKGIVNKLLHSPTVNLKKAATEGRTRRVAPVVEELFDLGE